MIYLYDSTETNFSYNGKPLPTTYDVEVKNTLNGEYYVTAKHPLDKNGVYKELFEDRIIKVHTMDGMQPFRIVSTNKHELYVELEAWPLFYADMRNKLVKPLALKNASGQQAINAFVNNLLIDTPFDFYSNITNTHDYHTQTTDERENNPKELFSALDIFKDIVNRWGGELWVRGYDIRMNDRIGTDTEAMLYEKKNISEFVDTTNIEGIVTRLHGITEWTGDREEGQDEAPEHRIETTIDSPLINNYSGVIFEKQYRNNDIRTKKELEDWLKLKFTTENIDKPQRTIEVGTHIIDGTSIKVGDTLILKYVKHDVDVRIKVVGYIYDGFANKVKSLVLGEPKKTTTSSIGNTITDLVNDIVSPIDRKSTIAMNSADGKNTVFHGTADPNTLGLNAKENDTYFRTNGSEKEIWRFTGTLWELIMDTSDTTKNADAIAEQQQDIDDAKEAADEAVNSINTAVSNAGFTSLDETINSVQSVSNAAKTNAQTALNQSQDALGDANTALTNAQTALNQVDGAISSAGEALTKANDAQTAANILSGQVSGFETTVAGFNQTVNNYEGQVSGFRNDILGLESTVANYESEVDEFGNAVSTYATEVSTMRNTVSGFESTVATYGTEVSGLTGEVAGYKNQVSTLNNTVDGFNSVVTQVQYDLDNIEIGGRNYIIDSKRPITSTSYPTGIFDLSQDIIVGETYTYQIKGTLKEGSTHWLFYSVSGQPFGATFQREQYDEEKDVYYQTFVATSTTSRVSIYPWPNTVGVSASIEWVKLEKGNKATDWTPAPEDMVTQVSELSNTVDGFQSKVDKVEQDYAGVSGTVATHSTSISNLDGQIALKANTTTVNALTGRVSTAETGITTNADAIKLKANTTTVNALTGRVNTAESSITANATAISLKANTTTVNALTGTVNTLSGKVDVTAGQISSKVWNTDIQTAIDGLEFEGRNHWVNSLMFDLGNYERIGAYGYYTVSGLKPNTDYTMSINPDIDLDSIPRPSGGNKALRINNKKENPVLNVINVTTTGVAVSKRVVTSTSEGELYILNYNLLEYGLGDLNPRGIILKESSVTQDWTPALEDTTSLINHVESELTQKYDSITGTVSSIDGRVATNKLSLDGLTTTVASKAAQSEVTQLATAVSTKVTSSQVNALIKTDKTVKDTRSVNELPTWYQANYSRETVREFKTLSVMGISGEGSFGLLETKIPWANSSGGGVKQTLTTDYGVWERSGIDGWNAWKKTADRTWVGSQITVLEDSITSTVSGIDGRVSTVEQNVSGLQTTVASKAAQSQVTQLSNSLSSVVTDLSNVDVIHQPGVNSKTFRNVHTFYDGSSAKNGMVRINTPITNGSMTTIRFTGYNYQSNRSTIDLTVSFYAYNASSILNHSYTNRGDFAITNVRVGRDSSGRAVILLGVPTTYWSYPTIDVEYVKVSFTTPPDSWKDGWSSSLTTATTGITALTTLQGMDTQSSITQNATNINLRVEKGDVISQINVEAGRTLIESKKILLNAANVVFTGTAWIPNSVIGTLDAGKITTGTLDAGKITVKNLDVSSLTGNTSNFVQSTWNTINDSLKIDSSGMQFHGTGGTHGTIGTREYPMRDVVNNLVGKKALSLHAESNAYVSLSYQGTASGTSGYTAMALEGDTGNLHFFTPSINVHGSVVEGVQQIFFADKQASIYAAGVYNDLFINYQREVHFFRGQTRMASFINGLRMDAGIDMQQNVLADVKQISFGPSAADMYMDTNNNLQIRYPNNMVIGRGAATHVIEFGAGVTLRSTLNANTYSVTNVNYLDFQYGASRIYAQSDSHLRIRYSNDLFIGRGTNNALQFGSGMTAHTSLNMNGNTVINSPSISDARLKDVYGMRDENDLEKLMQIEYVNFRWKDEQYGGQDFGFVAQQVNDIVPEMMMESSDGMLGYNGQSYLNFIGHSVQQLALRELNTNMVASQALQLGETNEEKIKRLEERIEELESVM